jgi:hypothetical protein
MTLISISHVNPFRRANYLLYSLIELWRGQGIDVEVGSQFSPDADLGFLHHNCTRMTPSDIPPVPDGLKVLNRNVLDISKRLYSELMISKTDDWDGPVIVKTNLNSYGNPERVGAARNYGNDVKDFVARHNWKLARKLPPKVYPVLESLNEVPNWVWRRDDLLVERFIPERQGDLFATRGWIFLGAASYGYRLLSTDPMVKVGSLVSFDYLTEIPPELEAARQRMGFDFGKFDYVIHDGRAILFDANKTPTFVGDPKSERITALANGIAEFLP